MRLFLPDMYVSSIYDIDLAQLKKRGIKGIITDLDNTLVEWDRPQATPELSDWLNNIVAHGFKVVVVSNNDEKRVTHFCEPLDLPFIYRARKPLYGSFQRAQQMMQLKTEDIMVIGDQLLTDILGGNRLGFFTVLVAPVAETDGFFTRFNRQLERLIFYRMRKKGLLD